MRELGSGVRRRSGLLGRLVVALAAFVMVAVGPSAVSAQSGGEAYPPKAIVNLLDPFGCDPAAISGEIGAVQAGSTVTLQLLINGVVVATITPTAAADGQVEYTIPVPPNRYGAAIVRASGTNTIGDPFNLDTSGTITACPVVIPKTGNSAMGLWLTLGAGAVLAGGVLVAASSRKRRGAVTA